MLRQTLTLLMLLPLLVACGDRNAPAPEATTAETPAPEATAPSQPSGDSSAPVGPISSRGNTVADGQPAAGESSGSIDFDMPKSWQSQTPKPGMRLSQAAIPGPGGPGEFAVFFFGPGGGGGVDANIERWINQMEATNQPKPETFEAGGMKVTWVDVKGTLKPSQMGMGPSEAVSNARLYGAVVEGPGGPWFFKATGPDATLAPQRDAFLAMLKSVRSKASA